MNVSVAAASSALGATLLARLLLKAIPGRWMGVLIGFAAGVLLAVALLGALPEALEDSSAAGSVPTVMLIGLIALFGIEAALRLGSAHHDEEGGLERGVSARVMMGSSLHHFADGALIATTFAASPGLGWGVALAVLAHEVPHKAGDLTVLVRAGNTPRRAIAIACISALGALPGAWLGALALELAKQAVPYCLALASASFLYITLSDLLPAMRREKSRRIQASQFVALIVGIGMIGGLEALAHA